MRFLISIALILRAIPYCSTFEISLAKRIGVQRLSSLIKPLYVATESSKVLPNPPKSILDSVNSRNPLLIPFIMGWRDALLGNQTMLQSIVGKDATWDNPFVSSATQLFEGLTQFSQFFSEPALTIYNVTMLNSAATELEIEYQLSFWYPMLWRPRIIIPGRAYIRTNDNFDSVSSVKENWDVSVLDIFTKQLPPRFWDFYHVFCSPTPEYPPVKVLGQAGQVSFVELPRTVAIEYKWTGLGKYPGPPLLALPGFALTGELRTSRPNRDPFYTALPVEVQSSRFISPTGAEMKTSSWILHVPTALQQKVFEEALSERKYDITDIDNFEDEDADDLVDEVDFQASLENLSVMKSITGGVLRGNYTLDENKLVEFAENEKIEYFYRILPKRIVAQLDIFGEATPERISKGVQVIKKAIESKGSVLLRRPFLIKPSATKNEGELNLPSIDEDVASGIIEGSNIGLQLHYVKGCFNMMGVPAMAIYESQYAFRHTRVFLELEDGI